MTTLEIEEITELEKELNEKVEGLESMAWHFLKKDKASSSRIQVKIGIMIDCIYNLGLRYISHFTDNVYGYLENQEYDPIVILITNLHNIDKKLVAIDWEREVEQNELDMYLLSVNAITKLYLLK